MQGQDPLAMLLAARERQFAAAMSSAAADHERAVQRLKAAMAATTADDKMQVCKGLCTAPTSVVMVLDGAPNTQGMQGCQVAMFCLSQNCVVGCS